MVFARPARRAAHVDRAGLLVVAIASGHAAIDLGAVLAVAAGDGAQIQRARLAVIAVHGGVAAVRLRCVHASGYAHEGSVAGVGAARVAVVTVRSCGATAGAIAACNL